MNGKYAYIDVLYIGKHILHIYEQHTIHPLKYIFTISILFFFTCAQSLTLHSVTDGYWYNAAVWSTNTVPKDGDSIFVHHQILATGDTLFLHDVYLNVTDSGCLCGEQTQVIFDNSELITSGHMAFISLTVQSNSNGYSSGVLLLTQWVLATSNSNMTILGGIDITPENDLTCHCISDSSIIDTTSGTDSSGTKLLLDFEFELGLTDDTLRICPGDIIEIKRSPALTFQWSGGETTNYIAPSDSGWYALVLSDSTKEATDSLYIIIRKPVEFIFPNVLTPNDDGQNDKVLLEDLILGNFQVYNRWGRLIYQYDSSMEQIKQFPFAPLTIPDGMYYYILSVEDSCNARDQLPVQKGWFYISR